VRDLPVSGPNSRADNSLILMHLLFVRGRKVKCDEAKPICERCSSTGRRCEGYKDPDPPKVRTRRSKYSTVPDRQAHPAVHHTNSDVILWDMARREMPLLRQPLELVGSPEERRSFDYFCHRAVYDISGYFELGFWNHFVLQASRSEPCVRHALSALSALHESCELTSSPMKAASLKTLALKEYTKAVGLLANNIPSQHPPLQTILISCIIFIWIEFVHDDFEIALSHLKSGLKLLDERRTSALSCRVDESITQLLMRLRTQVTVHGHSTLDQNSNNTLTFLDDQNVPPPAFKDLLEARVHLDNQLANVFRFHRQIEDPEFVQYQNSRHAYPSLLSIGRTRESLLCSLQQWQAVIQQTFTGLRKAEDKMQINALAQLEIQSLLAINSLQTLFTTSQMVYDEYQLDFERMLSLAETLVQSTKDKPFVYSFDTGVIVVLLYIVLKCRDVGIRTKAVDLLKQAPVREGMWKRESVLELAEWKVQKEEAYRKPHPYDTLPNHARIYAEGARERVIDGKRETIILYKRGSTIEGGEDVWEEEETSIGVRLARVLGSS
jgi:hypothetical protein